jgi:hypothetical protein
MEGLVSQHTRRQRRCDGESHMLKLHLERGKEIRTKREGPGRYGLGGGARPSAGLRACPEVRQAQTGITKSQCGSSADKCWGSSRTIGLVLERKYTERGDWYIQRMHARDVCRCRTWAMQPDVVECAGENEIRRQTCSAPPCMHAVRCLLAFRSASAGGETMWQLGGLQ